MLWIQICNKSNLDPEFWPTLDSDPGLSYPFWEEEKKIKNNIREKQFFFKKQPLFNYRIKKLFSQLSFWMMNLCIKSDTFCLYFIQYLHVWIQIQKAPEYRTDLIRIRFHNTVLNQQIFGKRIRGSGSATLRQGSLWFRLCLDWTASYLSNSIIISKWQTSVQLFLSSVNLETMWCAQNKHGG